MLGNGIVNDCHLDVSPVTILIAEALNKLVILKLYNNMSFKDQKYPGQVVQQASFLLQSLLPTTLPVL